jgi:hypothetical protein
VQDTKNKYLERIVAGSCLGIVKLQARYPIKRDTLKQQVYLPGMCISFRPVAYRNYFINYLGKQLDMKLLCYESNVYQTKSYRIHKSKMSMGVTCKCLAAAFPTPNDFTRTLADSAGQQPYNPTSSSYHLTPPPKRSVVGHPQATIYRS